MAIAVASLPVIILALVAMIVIWGLGLLFKALLQSMADHVPLIGGTLGRAVGSIIEQAATLGSEGARAVISDATGFILSPVYWIERHIVSVINLFAGLVDAIRYITSTLIPDEVATLETDIQSAYHDAIGYVQSVAHLIYAVLADDVADLEAQIAAAESAVEGYAQALAAAAEAYTTAAITAETRFVLGIAGDLASEIDRSAAAEGAYAQSLYHDAVAYTRSLVAQAEAATATDITAVTDWTAGQVTALQAAIAAMGTTVLAQSIAAVSVVATDLGTLESECTDNLCSGLSDLASLFNQLTGDLGLAALFGLAADFAADPRRAAADVAGALGPVTADAAGAVRTLIGL